MTPNISFRLGIAGFLKWKSNISTTVQWPANCAMVFFSNEGNSPCSNDKTQDIDIRNRKVSLELLSPDMDKMDCICGEPPAVAGRALALISKRAPFLQVA
jgi:hypothetical protein